MKDFDQERKVREEETLEERTFVLGGETFIAKGSVRPEVMLSFETIEEGTPPSAVLSIADQLIIDMTEPGEMVEVPPVEPGDGPVHIGEAHKRYYELRKTDAVDMTTLLDLCQWLVASVTGRPTDPPVASSPLPGTPTGGTPSTGDSSLEDSTEG